MMFQYSTLPSFAQELFFSDEFFDALLMMRATYMHTPQHEQMLDTLIDDLFARTVEPRDLERVIVERFGFDTDIARACALDIILHAVLTIPGYFGDQTELYRSLGGDPENDLAMSPVVRGIIRRVNSALEEKIKKLNQVNLDKESEGMRELFSSHITDHFFAFDGDYKIRLNDTILALLLTYDAYNEKLLGALYENVQEIGAGEITLPDGTKQRPTVANWIKDFLGFSGGTISSIMLAKYISQNKNVSSLQERDKDAVRRLLETFIVLKNFPDSLDSIPEDQWKIIPYYHTEETTKIPRKEIRDDKVVPPPTITIVPAPEPQAMVKSVSPLGEISLDPGLRRDDRGGREDVKIDFFAVSNAIIAKTGVILSNDVAERVKKILETRIRNVRNDIDAKGRLMAPVTEGGASLGEEEANKMLAEAKNAQQMIAEGKLDEYASKKAVPEATPVVSAPPKDEMPKMVIKEVDGVPTLVEKPEKKGNGKKEEKEADNVSLDSRLRGNDKEGRTDKDAPHEGVHEIPHELERGQAPAFAKASARQSQKPSQTPTEPDPKQTPPVKVPPHLEDAKVIPVVVKTSSGTGERDQTQRTGSETTGSGTDLLRKTEPDPNAKQSQAPAPAIGAQKKPIPDVKAAPRLVTVVDELRALSMKDIRRISQDTNAACQKIADKINALAKESLSKRAEAINAWKESPAYALYLEIGQQNIGQDMAKLAEERKTAGKEYLTAEEFDALLDLNEKLRF